VSATVRLTVEIESLSLLPDGALGRVAALYRALLAEGYSVDLSTEYDDGDEVPVDPATQN
jgi:hypothetical protein